MQELHAINIFDTTTGKERTVYVSKEVYDEFRRGEWRISKNNDKHNANETQFSALHGGDDGAYENFHEFVDEDANPEKLLMEQLVVEKLYSALALLDQADRELIEALYFKELSERKFAERKKVSCVAIHNRKVRILKKLKEILE